MATKKGNEIATIDVAMVTITDDEENELALDTASKIQVTTVTETKDAVKLIIKGRLIAQKPQENTITGHTIVMTDNVFNPELAVKLQGGNITYKSGSTGPISKYEPPAVGSKTVIKPFKLNVYSAIYNAAGEITGYEKTTYPGCKGVPVAFNSEDDVFRVAEYTINSLPNTGESPYVMEYLDALPEVS